MENIVFVPWYAYCSIYLDLVFCQISKKFYDFCLWPPWIYSLVFAKQYFRNFERCPKKAQCILIVATNNNINYTCFCITTYILFRLNVELTWLESVSRNLSIKGECLKK